MSVDFVVKHSISKSLLKYNFGRNLTPAAIMEQLRGFPSKVTIVTMGETAGIDDSLQCLDVYSKVSSRNHRNFSSVHVIYTFIYYYLF